MQTNAENANLRRALAFSAVLMWLPGCAWQRISAPPTFQAQDRIPLRVGVNLSEDSASAVYGPMIVGRLREWQAFDGITFPYRTGDKVDAVLEMTVSGGWDTNHGENFARGFLIGLSWFTLSPVIGVRIIGNHSLAATLLSGDTEVFRCSFDEKEAVEFGLLANTNEVAQKADRLQSSRLAAELMRRLREKWPQISESLAR